MSYDRERVAASFVGAGGSVPSTGEHILAVVRRDA